MAYYNKGRKMKKVVLINPPSPWLANDRDIMPLGLLHLASYLKSYGVPFEFCDLASKKETEWAFPHGAIYGISACVSHDKVLRSIASELKSMYPESVVVSGGPHSSTLSEHILKTTLTDIAVIGEGEETLLEIARSAPLDKINGIAYKIHNNIVKNPLRPSVKDIDSLPYPQWDLIDVKNYSAIVNYRDTSIKGATLITSRGCPNNCSFCASPFLYERKVRFHGVAYILGMVDELIHTHGFNGLCFVDDVFTLNKKRLLELCNGLKKFNVPWRCLARTDTVDIEMLQAMKDSGCCQVDFGIESGAQKILDAAHKNVAVETQKQAVLMAKSVGISPKICIIVGLPGEDDSTITQTLEFISEVDVKCNFGFFVPLPGSDIALNPGKYRYKMKQGISYDSYLITSAGGYGLVFEEGKDECLRKYAKKIEGVLGDKYAYKDVLTKERNRKNEPDTH